MDSQTYSHDLNGNLTARPGQTLSYDENPLTRVVSGTLTTDMTHDGDGRLVKKIAPEGTTLYVSPSFEVTTAITPPPPQPTPNPALTHKRALPMVLSGGAHLHRMGSRWYDPYALLIDHAYGMIGVHTDR